MKTLLLKELEAAGDNPPKEPSFKVGITVGSVAGILAIVAGVFPNLLDETQVNLILVFTAFLLPIISAALTRGRVWSFASVQQVVQDAVNEAVTVAEGLRKSVPPVDPTPPSSSGFLPNAF